MGRRPLRKALENATYGVLYRHKNIAPDYAAWICHYAEEQVRAGKRYDTFGAARSGANSGCFGIFMLSVPGILIQAADYMKKDGYHDETFFCSELVVRAFEEADLPIIWSGAHTATPGAIAVSPYIKRIKEVVAV